MNNFQVVPNIGSFLTDYGPLTLKFITSQSDNHLQLNLQDHKH